MNAIHAFLPKCHRSLRPIFAVPLLILPLAAAEQDVLYNVDFSGPVHTLHQPPATGTAINRVSKVVYGSPEVVSTTASPDDHSLLFRGTGHDQIQFHITPGYAKYRIEYDVVTNNVKNSNYSFKVFLNTPRERSLHLHGRVNKTYSFPNHPIYNQSWEDGKKAHFAIEADFVQNKWEIWQDEIQIMSGALDGSTLETVSFRLAPWRSDSESDPSVTAVVDNIRITRAERLFVAPPRGPGNPGNEEILYEVDFEPPTHEIHQEPAVGGSIHQVTEIIRGSPKIGPTLSGPVDRSLIFRGKEGGEVIRFSVPPGWPKIRIEYDVVTQNLKNSRYRFAISLDCTGIIQHQQLHGSDDRVTFLPEIIPPGAWEEGVPTRFVLEIDFTDGRFETWQDGVLMGSASINTTDLHYVRFSLNPWTGGVEDDPSVVVGVNNIKVIGIDDYYPAPPETLSVNGLGSTNGILISWPKARFADSYRIYRGTLDTFGSAEFLTQTSSTQYRDTTAQPDLKYHYWVNSSRDIHESATAASGSGIMEPGPPLSLSISRGERADGISLSWMPGGMATSYRIYRSVQSDFWGATLVAQAVDTSYLDTSADVGNVYYYWVKSMRSSVEPVRSASGQGVRGFAPIQNVVVTIDPGTQRYRLAWGAVSGASRYTVYRSGENSFTNAILLRNVYGLAFTDDTAIPYGSYYYWVVPGSTETRPLSLWSGAGASVMAENAHPTQPDLWGKNALGNPIGRGIANETGAGQSITLSARTKRSLFGTVGIDTLSAGSEAVSLTGSVGNRDFKVNYFLNGNVTAAMNTGNLTISAGSNSPSVEVVVSPPRRSKGPSKLKSLALQVRGTSLRDQAASDLVILRAVMKSKR